MYEYHDDEHVTYEIVPYTRRRKKLLLPRIASVCLIAVCLGSSFGFGLGASRMIFGGGSATGETQAQVSTEAVEAQVIVENTTDYVMDVESEQSGIRFLNTTAAQVPANGVVNVVKQSASSVVSINISGTTRVYNRLRPFESAGSGIIIGEDSEKIYIATNNHVISDASSVTISLDDSKQVAANYVGSDYEADLAVISVKKSAMTEAGVTGYRIASTGNSNALEVGETVVAIGNALGEGKTATMGIISAKEKKIDIDNRSIKVLQTDAAINPGNSGGALVNMNAEVIGINTAKLSEVGVEGMGYSIPINEAIEIINKLISGGTPTESQPYLGIQGVNVDEQIKAANNLPSTGVYVYSVLSGSGAEAAGLRRGDLISAYNGNTVESMDSLTSLLKLSKAGDVVELAVYRNSSKAVVKVTLKDANQKF